MKASQRGFTLLFIVATSFWLLGTRCPCKTGTFRQCICHGISVGTQSCDASGSWTGCPHCGTGEDGGGESDGGGLADGGSLYDGGSPIDGGLQAVQWQKSGNWSATLDASTDLAADTTGVYVVGYDSTPGDIQWRMEKRYLGNGELRWSVSSNPGNGTDQATAVAVDLSGLYVVGTDSSEGNARWRMEKRDLNGGSLIWAQTSNPSAGHDYALGVVLDYSGLYVVGNDYYPGNAQWRIEKRDLYTGNLLWQQAHNPGAGQDFANAAALDSSGLYVAGYDGQAGDPRWRVEKRNLQNGQLLWAQQANPGPGEDYVTAAASDSTGLYLLGTDTSPGNAQWRLEKRALTNGALIWSRAADLSGGPDIPRALAVNTLGLFLAGRGPVWWHVERRELNQGNLVWSRDYDWSPGDEGAEGIAVDGTGVYLSGYATAADSGDLEWRIIKLDL